MDIFGQYKSPLGYQVGENQIDTYGVDHSGFTTRDEVAYQTARQQRENQIMQNYNGQGITQDYPQYGTDFWGSSPDNNFGFGVSNITPNVENMQNTPVLNNLNPSQNTQEDAFDRVFNRTLKEEGGYEDKPDKIDTATNMGFQQSTLDRFKQKHPDMVQDFPTHVKDLTREQGRIIARKDYYEPYRIGEIISPALQETMFDSFFNHSPQAPALWAQKAINQNTQMHVKEDGIFGSETINAMNQLSEDEIIKVNNAILRQRLEDHEQEKKTNLNPYYKDYTAGLPDRFKRFEIK